MTAPIHKTCYRCDRAVSEFVDPADVLGGQHGVCADCRLTTAAAEAAREWRWKNGLPDLDAPAEPSPLVLALVGRAEKQERGHLSFEDGSQMTDAQLAEMNAGLGLVKDKAYRPYCLRCDFGPRVALKPFGFECWHCGNRMDFSLRKLPDADIPREITSPAAGADGA